jgi:hypothetical protein
MTGAAFACLLPLLKAKAAADPEAFEALTAGATAGAAADGADATAGESPLAAAAGLVGRVNLTYSDLPYVSFTSELV